MHPEDGGSSPEINTLIKNAMHEFHCTFWADKLVQVLVGCVGCDKSLGGDLSKVVSLAIVSPTHL